MAGAVDNVENGWTMETKISQPSLVKELLIGFCLGAANIIPGVSGGTFLLIFKIYQRVFSILGNINKPNILHLLSLIWGLVFTRDRKESLNKLIAFFQENDFIFLMKLIIGAVIAIISLSSLMEYLIVNRFSMTYALFFGLILVSIVIPVRMIKEKKIVLLLFFFIGAAATIYVTWAVNPYDKVEKKSNMYKVQYLKDKVPGEPTDAGKTEGPFSYSGKYTIDEYIYSATCGAVSVSAMVLPGVSGSLVLILMGQYFEVVSAISGLRTLSLDNILFLSCFGIGIIFGGLLFARLISAVLKRCYNATMAFLTGLMTGSLYALWPFKKSIVMAEQYIKEDGVIKVLDNVRIYTNINEFPVMGSQLYLSLATFALGCVIMSFFLKQETDSEEL